MSDHYYLWSVVLVGPVGQRLVVAWGLTHFRAVKRKRALEPNAPTGWSYELERSKAA